MATLILIVLVAWLASLSASVWAILLALSDDERRCALAIAPAALALTIGYLGFGHWSPFRFFPQIGWMYTSGDFRIHIASSWFFVAPLLIGGAAFALVILRKVTGTGDKSGIK